jgi:hypothetical protein
MRISKTSVPLIPLKDFGSSPILEHGIFVEVLSLQRGREHYLIGGTTKSRGRAIAAGPTARLACPAK